MASNTTKLTEIKSKMAIARNWGGVRREGGDIVQNVHTSSYKRENFWRSNVEYIVDSIVLKVAKEVYLSCSHCTHKENDNYGGVTVVIIFQYVNINIFICYFVHIKLDFPHRSVSKEPACNAGDLGSIPGSERSPGEGNSNPLQYSCLENPMDRGTWQTTIHVVARVGHNLATKLPPLHIKLTHFYIVIISQ